jgi:hypothetical protein
MRSVGAVSHGIIDYVLAGLLLFGPEIGHFATGRHAIFCRVLGAILLIVALLTRYPLGVVKMIGFVSHGIIELILGIVVLVLPWTRGFSAGVLSRNFFVAIAVLMLAVWMLTDFRAIRGRLAAATSSSKISSTTSASTTTSSSSTSSSTKTS